MIDNTKAGFHSENQNLTKCNGISAQKTYIVRFLFERFFFVVAEVTFVILLQRTHFENGNVQNYHKNY